MKHAQATLLLLLAVTLTGVTMMLFVNLGDSPTQKREPAGTGRGGIVENSDKELGLAAQVVFEKVRFVLFGCNTMYVARNRAVARIAIPTRSV